MNREKHPQRVSAAINVTPIILPDVSAINLSLFGFHLSDGEWWYVPFCEWLRKCHGSRLVAYGKIYVYDLFLFSNFQPTQCQLTSKSELRLERSGLDPQPLIQVFYSDYSPRIRLPVRNS